MQYRLSFLDFDFSGRKGYEEYRRLYDVALDAVLKFDAATTEGCIKKMKWPWCGRCCEHLFLKSLFFLARDAAGDCSRAVATLKGLVDGLGACLRRRRDISPENRDYAKSLLVRALYYMANGLYYTERDRQSLAVYRKCLEAASRQPKLEFDFIDDVRRKTASLEFSLSGRGLRRVEYLVAHGRFSEACEIADHAMSNFGMEYLDHGAIAVIAAANLSVGNVKKGRRLIDLDFENSPKCLETRFVFAMAHRNSASMRKRRIASNILHEIASGSAKSSCKISVQKKGQMQRVARAVLNGDGCYNGNLRGQFPMMQTASVADGKCRGEGRKRNARLSSS